MKTENTLENKAKFFAQYWWQEIFIFEPNNQKYRITKSRFNSDTLRQKCHLELKPLSQISDEDFENIAKHYESTAYNIYITDYGIEFNYLEGNEIQNMIIDITYDYSLDYLRSKGYALPWMDLSINDLIEYGWIKLE